MKNGKIHGQVYMRPHLMTAEQNSAYAMGLRHSCASDFLSEFNRHIDAMRAVSECAKVYIDDHWRLIEDWTDLNIIIDDLSGETVEYYNYKEDPRLSKTIDNELIKVGFLTKIDGRNKAKHNPILRMDDIRLDYGTGFLTVIINGRVHEGIEDEAIVLIADFIERQLSI